MTKEKIIQLLTEYGDMRPHDLLQHLPIKKASLHRQLHKLQQEKVITKVGMPPKVIYKLAPATLHAQQYIVSSEDAQLLTVHFAQITLSGFYLEGKDAFVYWCQKQSLPFEKTLDEYKKALQKYAVYRQDGLINGQKKIEDTFENVAIDEIYYIDFYSIERFGKTKLGQLMLYAKQSQNIQLMKKVSDMVELPIRTLLQKKECDAICFIPPTVKREVQFMKLLQAELSLPLPVVVIDKIHTEITVPQKSISKLDDRIENARTIMYVPLQPHFNTVLLIDDAMGSGATMNEAAAKLKKAGICTKIIGLALTGSFNGFEVLNEV